jgi:hypothetical protein
MSSRDLEHALPCPALPCPAHHPFSMNRSFEYDDIPDANLYIDAIYKPTQTLGGKSGRRKIWHDPLKPLVNVGPQRGFRWYGRKCDAPYMVLFSNSTRPEWPDRFNERTGEVVYYGDNHLPGQDLHTPAGNSWLRDNYLLSQSTSSDRTRVIPALLFINTTVARTYKFKGLAVPTDLVSRWYGPVGEKFVNYEATFVILDIPYVSRAWLNALVKYGKPALSHIAAPSSWHVWRNSGILTPLTPVPVSRVYTKEQQLPRSPEDWLVLDVLYSHFPDAYGFDRFAIWLMLDMYPDTHAHAHAHAHASEHTGQFIVFNSPLTLTIHCVVVAKSRDPHGQGIGLGKIQKLINHLGPGHHCAYVTTGYVCPSAYKQAHAQNGRIKIICGMDIVHHLRNRNPPTPTSANHTRAWLRRMFPR